MHLLFASVRLTIVTIGLCAVAYTAVVLGLAKALMPEAARGSLVAVDGKIVGSRLVAQKFTRPDYFWPRPSAVDYNGAGAGGSNLSPTSTTLTDRAKQTVDKYGADIAHPLPAELAAASGSGLDPHITEQAALYQAARVAKARSLPQDRVEALITQQAFSPGAAFAGRLVNVLELNLALNAIPRPEAETAVKR